MTNGNLIVKLDNDSGVDDHDIAKSINQMPCHLGSYIRLTKRLTNLVIREIDGFYSINIENTTEIQIVPTFIKNVEIQSVTIYQFYH